MRITIRAPITHRCPFKDEQDVGTVEASWTLRPPFIENETVYDLHRFDVWLADAADRKISHEEFTDTIAKHLAGHGCADVEVITRWQTAGFDVECRA